MLETDSPEKKQLALKICHLYYEDGISQSEIAQQLKLSRPTVSRLLQYARTAELVKITIVDPQDDLELLAAQLKAKYGLKDVLIAENYSIDYDVINDKLGQLAAQYLDKIVKDNDIIGISWGKTMAAVANNLRPNEHKNIQVVQLKGSVAAADINNFANEINLKFGQAFQTNTVNLPLPVIFDAAVTKNIVSQDRFIKSIMALEKAANIALFTSGTVRDDALLFNLGYFNAFEVAKLQVSAVGDLVSRFITAEGKIADNAINDRTIGVTLADLQQKDYSILVAGAQKKLASIHGVLVGNYANVLVTDRQTAINLVNQFA